MPHGAKSGPDPALVLARAAAADSTFEETMHLLLESAVAMVDKADFAGMTLIAEGGIPTTPFFTDELSPHLDQAQYDAGRGPCIDAWRRARPVIVDTLDGATEFPEFERAAKRIGVESTLGVPLRSSGRVIGALNLYACEPASFDDHDAVRVDAIAQAIGTAIANAAAYWEAFELSQQLSEAMANRAVIEQAKGVLMATTGIDADGAFELLRAQSQAENRKLRDIARELVERQQIGRPTG